MRISGFTFLRNAVNYDFPFRESLRSLLPLCDEVVIAVGRSEDNTLEEVRALDDGTMRITETVWDDALREGGRVYAQQTQVALDGCTGDWCLYLQGDEVIHEEDYERIRTALERADRNPNVEALLFDYLHFYGSYGYIGTGRQWYRREIRAVRNTGNIVSWRDAQGFRRRTTDGAEHKLRAAHSSARIFHYGWVQHPRTMQTRRQAAHHFYHDDGWIEQQRPTTTEFNYTNGGRLVPYRGTHPAVMRGQIERSQAWAAHFDPGRMERQSLRVRVLDSIERFTGVRIGEYRNYVAIGKS